MSNTSPLPSFCAAAVVKAGWFFRKLAAGSKLPPAGIPVEDSNDLEVILGWIEDGFQAGLLLGNNELAHFDFEAAAMELIGDADFGPALRWRSQSGGLAVIASTAWVARRFGPGTLDGERYVSRTAHGELVARQPKKGGAEVLLLEIRSAKGKYVLVPGCRGPAGEYTLLNGQPAPAQSLPDPALSDAALDLLLFAARGPTGRAGRLPRLETIDALRAHIVDSGEHGRHTALFEAAACGANLVARGQADEEEVLACLYEAGRDRAASSTERREISFSQQEVAQTIASVWRLSTALAARKNGRAPSPTKADYTSLATALDILEEAAAADDPSLLFEHVNDLAGLTRADLAILLQRGREVFKERLAKTELIRATDEARQARTAAAKEQELKAAQARRADREAKAESGLHRNAAGRREIPLEEAGLARDPKAIHDDAVAALVARNSPERLFLRAGRPARIGVDDENDPTIHTVKDKELQSELINAAVFVGRNRAGLPQPVDPPVATIRTLLGCDGLPFPRLTGIVRSPVMRRDGSILMREGYDRETGLYLKLKSGFVIPGVPDAPTKEEMARARELLLDVFSQFSFKTESSRANSLALLLTSFVQPVVDDNRPLCAISAPQAGSGKGEIAGACARVGTGRGPRITRLRRDDEFEKKLGHLLYSGTPYICIDNAKGRLESDVLESTLTDRRFSDRKLGRNDEGFDVPQNATWCATGNNLELGTEMARRSYSVELDPKDPRPEDREGPRPGEVFKRLPVFVLTHRGELIWAVLTLCRAWFAAGCPRPKLRAFGSFERWQDVVGGVLEVAGVPQFLENRAAMRVEQDEERRQWCVFAREILRSPGLSPFTTRQLKSAVDRFSALKEALPDGLAPLLAKDALQDVGNALLKKKDTRLASDGLRITRIADDLHEKVARWAVVVGEEVPSSAR